MGTGMTIALVTVTKGFILMFWKEWRAHVARKKAGVTNASHS